MIAYNVTDRIDINKVVEKLKEISDIYDTDSITIPLNRDKYNEKMEKSLMHSKDNNNLSGSLKL